VKAVTRVALVCFIAQAVCLFAYGAMHILLSPKERFLSECEEMYPYLDCWERWQREHPMPDDYGRQP
jgi:hypothetical protein